MNMNMNPEAMEVDDMDEKTNLSVGEDGLSHDTYVPEKIDLFDMLITRCGPDDCIIVNFIQPPLPLFSALNIHTTNNPCSQALESKMRFPDYSSRDDFYTQSDEIWNYFNNNDDSKPFQDSFTAINNCISKLTAVRDILKIELYTTKVDAVEKKQILSQIWFFGFRHMIYFDQNHDFGGQLLQKYPEIIDKFYSCCKKDIIWYYNENNNIIKETLYNIEKLLLNYYNKWLFKKIIFFSNQIILTVNDARSENKENIFKKMTNNFKHIICRFLIQVKDMKNAVNAVKNAVEKKNVSTKEFEEIYNVPMLILKSIENNQEYFSHKINLNQEENAFKTGTGCRGEKKPLSVPHITSRPDQVSKRMSKIILKSIFNITTINLRGISDCDKSFLLNSDDTFIRQINHIFTKIVLPPTIPPATNTQFEELHLRIDQEGSSKNALPILNTISNYNINNLKCQTRPMNALMNILREKDDAFTITNINDTAGMIDPGSNAFQGIRTLTKTTTLNTHKNDTEYTILFNKIPIIKYSYLFQPNQPKNVKFTQIFDTSYSGDGLVPLTSDTNKPALSADTVWQLFLNNWKNTNDTDICKKFALLFVKTFGDLNQTITFSHYARKADPKILRLFMTGDITCGYFAGLFSGQTITETPNIKGKYLLGDALIFYLNCIDMKRVDTLLKNNEEIIATVVLENMDGDDIDNFNEDDMDGDDIDNITENDLDNACEDDAFRAELTRELRNQEPRNPEGPYKKRKLPFGGNKLISNKIKNNNTRKLRHKNLTTNKKHKYKNLTTNKKHKSRKHKSKKHKSKKHKSKKHKSRKHKSRKHKSRKHKSRKHKSRK